MFVTKIFNMDFRCFLASITLNEFRCFVFLIQAFPRFDALQTSLLIQMAEDNVSFIKALQKGIHLQLIFTVL